jgi:hypothetical protein
MRARRAISLASLAKREEERNTPVAEIVARILSKIADRENGGNAQRFGETETQATTASRPEAA